MKKKRMFVILCIVFLTVVCIKFAYDRMVILRVSYEFEDGALLFPEKLPTIRQGGGGDNAEHAVFGPKVKNDTGYTVIDINLFKPTHLWTYSMYGAIYVDGKSVDWNIDYISTEEKTRRFWEADVEIYFHYDSNGELFSQVKCGNSSKINVKQQGQDAFFWEIYK